MNTSTMGTMPRNAARPPSRLLQLLEGRAPWELASTLSLWPWLRFAPKGDGHPVLVLPGLVASDLSTRLLRRYLRERGYDVHGWGLGRNLGLRHGIEDGMFQKLHAMYRGTGRKVSIVGWSLGGLYARFLGKHHPDEVRNVITLGSPITGHPKASNAWQVYEWASGQPADDPRQTERVRGQLTMPSTSIFSRTDGIVSWGCSLDAESDHSENVEVFASHIGLGVHPAVLLAVADRLAQPEGAWQPFDRSGLRSLVYPDPKRA